MNELVNIERWGYHLKHCAIAFGLYLICVNLGIPKFYSAIISGTVLLFIKQLEAINTLENYLMLLQNEGYEFIVPDTTKIKGK